MYRPDERVKNHTLGNIGFLKRLEKEILQKSNLPNIYLQEKRYAKAISTIYSYGNYILPNIQIASNNV